MIATDEPAVYYTPFDIPADCHTKKEWHRRGYKPRHKAEPAGKVIFLLTRPHDHMRPMYEPAPAEYVEEVKHRLNNCDGQPSPEDRGRIKELELSNQAIWANLYTADQVKPIKRLTQTDAWEELERIWRTGNSDLFIASRGTDPATGRKKVWTVGGKVRGEFTILDHKKGDPYLGMKKGVATKLLVIDLDRHHGEPAAEHVARVLATLRWAAEMDTFAPHPSSVNPKDGSTQIQLLLPKAVAIKEARELAAEIRHECPWVGNCEIYPDNKGEILCPLRRDKLTIISNQILKPSVPTWRKVQRGRVKIRERYLAMDAVAYVEWLKDPNREPVNLQLVERTLREICGLAADVPLPPPSPPGQASTKPSRVKPQGREASTGPRAKERKASSTAGMASVGPMKGRWTQTAVEYWSGLPGFDDTVCTKLSTMTLREFCCVENMPKEEAIAWVMAGFESRLNESGTGPLVYDQAELLRVVTATAEAVYKDNGYQTDPGGSSAIWEKIRGARERTGFKLSDPTTWDRYRTVQADPAEIAWTPELESHLPKLANILHTDVAKARQVLAVICKHVDSRSEMALPYLEKLIREAGVKSYRDKTVTMKRYLVAAGILIMVKKGFRPQWAQAAEIGGVGTHYALGRVVQLLPFGATMPEEPALVILTPTPATAATTPIQAGGAVSTSSVFGLKDLDRLAARWAQRQRILAAEDRWKKRLSAVFNGWRTAA